MWMGLAKLMLCCILAINRLKSCHWIAAKDKIKQKSARWENKHQNTISSYEIVSKLFKDRSWFSMKQTDAFFEVERPIKWRIVHVVTQIEVEIETISLN